MTTKERIAAAVSLPVEEMAIVADSILRSLNAPEPQIDKKWAAVAQRRLTELRSGKVKAIPGEEVFARIWKRFEGSATRFTRETTARCVGMMPGQCEL